MHICIVLLLFATVQERYEFSAADTRFRSVMKSCERNPEVLVFTDTQGVLSDLQVRVAIRNGV